MNNEQKEKKTSLYFALLYLFLVAFDLYYFAVTWTAELQHWVFFWNALFFLVTAGMHLKKYMDWKKDN